jgi:GTPase involved in cell partitioning and DNA repair
MSTEGTTSANAGQAGDAGAGNAPAAGAQNTAGNPPSGTTGAPGGGTGVMGQQGTDQQGGNGAAAGNGQGTGTEQSVMGARAEDLVITLPEGTQIDEEMLKSYRDVAQKAGLNSESASAVATWYAEQVVEHQKAEAAAWDEQNKTWASALREDPEFGGSNSNYDVSVTAWRTTHRWRNSWPRWARRSARTKAREARSPIVAGRS